MERFRDIQGSSTCKVTRVIQPPSPMLDT